MTPKKETFLSGSRSSRFAFSVSIRRARQSPHSATRQFAGSGACGAKQAVQRWASATRGATLTPLPGAPK